MHANALRYAKRGHKKVNGWLADFSALFIAELADHLDHEGIHGPSAEIGTHHGRLFVLLHLLNGRGRDLVIDVFEDQHLNSDGSGKGDKDILFHNLQAAGGDTARVHVLQRSSLEVRPEDILEAVGEPRLFSIDGGHSIECAGNDLRLADATLAADGMVVLDDFFNEFWPEVAMGTMAFCTDPATRLRPFAVSPGKLYLCRPDRQAFMHEAIKSRFSRRYIDKEARMFGVPVLVTGIRHGRRGPLTQFGWNLAESPLAHRFGITRWLPAKALEPL